MIKPIKIGLAGLALLVVALSNQKVRDTYSDTLNTLKKTTSFGVGAVDDYDRFGSYSVARYRREPFTLNRMSTPLELSDDDRSDEKHSDNPFVAEYIRKQAIEKGLSVPSVKNYIPAGTAVTLLQRDDSGIPGWQLMAELDDSQRPSQ